MAPKTLVRSDRVERAILVLRGHRVILDSDLAALYGVETRRLNEQVRRNVARFPPDFAFQLSSEEFAALISQIATSNAHPGRGGRRKLPYAFTEHGALMAASVLNSTKAVAMSILVVRTFVRFRRLLATHSELAAKIDEMEREMNRRLAGHDKSIAAQRQGILSLYSVIENLMPKFSDRQIGFQGPGTGESGTPKR
jgi:hypothetical protein